MNNMSDKDKERYVLRGGSWYYFPPFARCSSGYLPPPTYGYIHVGVRLSKTLSP